MAIDAPAITLAEQRPEHSPAVARIDAEGADTTSGRREANPACTLDQDALAWANIADLTCSEEVCPTASGLRRIDWQLADPKNLPLKRVRTIRDEIERCVARLIRELDLIRALAREAAA